MEEENEVLDWGNEDDEQQHPETYRKASDAEFDCQGTVDDVEDSVSLGEDEDEHDYFAYQQEESNGDTESKDVLPAKSASKDDPQQQHSKSSQELQRQRSSTSQNLSSAAGSPEHNQSLTDQHSSPQRSQSFTTRLTHALPPKPVVANVPYLHPSHPSIVEATAMSTRRSESLKNKSNGASTTTASTTGIKSNGADAPLPAGWEARNPRSGGHKIYYYNIQTEESTWERPSHSSTAIPALRESRGRSTRRRRERSRSTGGRPTSSSKSDQPTPQEHLRASRVQPRLQGDSDPTDPQPPLQQVVELSFEDRHYRPQDMDDNVAIADSRQGDRVNEHVYTPPASPQRSRERARGRDCERGRSLTPVRSAAPALSRGRDSRSSRGSRAPRGGRHGHAITDTDSSTQRDHDSSVAAFASARNALDHPPSNIPVDVNSNNSQQGSRRQQRQQQSHSSNFDSPFEPTAFEDRPPLTRNGSTQGRNRGREPRAMEGREQQIRGQNLSTTSRTRSTPPHPHDRELDTPKADPNQPLLPRVSASAPTLDAMPAPPQRKRDRPSRFDRPATTVLPVVGVANVSAQIITPVEQAIVRPLEDDVYIPDDIIQASRERIRHIVRDELTPASQQIVLPGTANGSPYPDKRSRQDERGPDWDQGQSVDQGRTSPTSEHQGSRRRRAPLPPQDIRFHEAVNRPQQAPLDADKTAPYLKYRPPPPPQLSPSSLTTVLPQGPRDHNHQRSANSTLPSRPRYPPQSQFREIDMQRSVPGIDSGRRNDRRPPGASYAQSLSQSEVVMEVDINDHHSTSSRIPPSPSSRNSEAQAGLRVGAGMYADREGGGDDVLPRGPRAMASKHIPDDGFPPPSAPLSPPTPYAHGPNVGSRGRDRSPLPHQSAYASERETGYDNSRHEGASGWRDERSNQGLASNQGLPYNQGLPSNQEYPVQERSHGHNRREPRGRPNEFPRQNLLKLSGTNSVPIGNRKGGPQGGTLPAGLPSGNHFASNPQPPSGISNANMEPLRNQRVRGAQPPNKELYERERPSYEGKSRVDTYIPGGAGPLQRRRDGSPVTLEQHHHQRPMSPVDPPTTREPTRARQESQYTVSEKPNRYDHPLPADSAAPRIWTPRQPSPRNAVRRASLSGGSDFRDATPPPISREPSQFSPTWESSGHGREGSSGRFPDEGRVQHRYGNSRDATLKVDVRQRHQANVDMDHGNDRFIPTPEVQQQAGSLEGRLGDRYDEGSFAVAVRQPHALPPNPTLHPDHYPVPPESRSKSFPDRRGPLNHERSQISWADAVAHSSSQKNHDAHLFDDQGPRDIRNARPQKPLRPRRPPSTHQDDSVNMDMEGPQPESSQYGQQRPEMSRRGGSLLDRLSLDHNDDTQGMGTSWSSLRDRVQVPSKRDRDEMSGGRYQPDILDGDDGVVGDPASKRPRRRNPKFRRGGKRGGMP